MSDDLLTQLADEADLCRNEGADDVANLLDAAHKAIANLRAENDLDRRIVEHYRWSHDPEHCTGDECMDCGVLDCPSGEPLHYHHDGCPACDLPDRGALNSRART